MPTHCRNKPFPCAFAHLCERQPHRVGAQPEKRLSNFDGNGVDFAEQSLDKVVVIRLDHRRRCMVSLEKRCAEFMNLSGTDICQNAYNAFCTERQTRRYQSVVARINVKRITTKSESFAKSGNIAVRFFIATMFGISFNSAYVSGKMFSPVRDGTL